MTEQNTLPKGYLCTRPRLARALMDAGKEPEEIVNPWEPKLKAWMFNLDAQTVSIVQAFYEQIGKPVPSMIVKASEVLAQRKGAV